LDFEEGFHNVDSTDLLAKLSQEITAYGALILSDYGKGTLESVQQMIADGATEFIEVGPGKVLQGLVKKINKEAVVASAEL